MANLESVEDIPRLPARRADSHKGTFGHALVIAGSRGMSGAAALAGMAALRGGAGLVSVACPDVVAPIVATIEPSYLTFPCPSNSAGQFSCRAVAPILSRPADAVALGPGMGQSADLGQFVRALASATNVPLVLDADALNVLSTAGFDLAPRAAATILTPHPGEFARASGLTTAEIAARRVDAAADFARDKSVIVVLKGHQTVVTDGQRVFLNDTGNPGMATGGTGDVLTGLLVALLAQGIEPFGAACLAARAHGRAGDLAMAAIGGVSIIASDLLAALPRALAQWADAGTHP